MIDVSPHQLEIIQKILRQHVPDCEVRAFGSRVTWTAKDYSDLDLVIVDKKKLPQKILFALKEDFVESELSFRVEILDWNEISPEFKKNIEKRYEIIPITQKNKFKKTEIGLIPEGWTQCNLKDIAYFKNGKSSPARSEKASCPVFGSNGIIGYSDKFNADNATVIIGRVGSYCGSIYYSDYKCWVTDNAIVGTAKKNHDSQFLYYLLRNLNLNKHRSGSGQPLLNQGILNSIQTLIPKNINEQRTIAKILSDLDAKIELNHQMNKTLEQIAQVIFKHWFIDFEFPNEKGKPYKSNGSRIVESEKGKIPEGWHISRIGKELKTVLGGTPDRAVEKYWKKGNIPWINSGKINEFRIIKPSEYITQEGLNNSATKLLPKKTVVIAITGATLGKISLLEIESCSNQSVVGILESEKIFSEYIYFWIKNIIEDILSWQTGGAQQHINKANINNSLLLIPEEKVIIEYLEIVKPLFDKITLNCFEILNLTTICDTLLPKLMSGKIRVERGD